VSSSGQRTSIDAVDPVSLSAPKIVFGFAFNRNTMSMSLLGTVEQLDGIGATVTSLRLIIQVGANSLFRAPNYYAGAALQKGTETRRIVSSRYLNTSTNYASPSQKSDRVLLVIASMFSSVSPAESVTLENPSDLSDGIHPLIFVPGGEEMDNYYRNYVVYNQTTEEYRPVRFYDGTCRIVYLDTSDLGGVGWTTGHVLSLRQGLPLQSGVLGTLGTATSLVIPHMLDFRYAGGFARISASPTDLEGETRRIIQEDAASRTLVVDRAFTTIPGSAMTNGVFRDAAFTIVNGSKQAIATLAGDYSWLGIGTQFKVGNTGGILDSTTFSVTEIIPPTIYERGNRAALIGAQNHGDFLSPFHGPSLVSGDLVDGMNNLNPSRAAGSYVSFFFPEPIVLTGFTIHLGGVLPATEQFTIQGVSGELVTNLATFENVRSSPHTVNFPNSRVYDEYRLMANNSGAVIISVHEIDFTVSTTFVRYMFDTVPASATTYRGGTTNPGEGHFYEIVSLSTYYEVLPFSHDNLFSINIPSQLTKESDFEIRLLTVTLPNHLLRSSYGGRMVDYPYLYVKLSSSTPMTNQIFSNNRSSPQALFKVPVVDIAESWRSSYIKLSSPGMAQRCNFNLQDGVSFEITTPDGNVIETIAEEWFSPNTPNPLAQISATFSIEVIPRQTPPRMLQPADAVADVDALEGYTLEGYTLEGYRQQSGRNGNTFSRR
jgi:hypothetical protein